MSLNSTWGRHSTDPRQGYEESPSQCPDQLLSVSNSEGRHHPIAGIGDRQVLAVTRLSMPDPLLPVAATNSAPESHLLEQGVRLQQGASRVQVTYAPCP